MKSNTLYPKTGQDNVVLTREASLNIGQTQAAGNTLVICDPASLQQWERQLRTGTSSHNLPAVLFQLPEFSDLQNRSLSALAHGYQMECGCTIGSLFMSVTVVALLVSYFGSGGHLSGIHLAQVGSFLGITILSLLSGKLLGMFWARWRLLRLSTSVHNMIVRAA